MPGFFGIVCPNVDEIPAALHGMHQKLLAGGKLTNECWMDDKAGAGFGRQSLGIYDRTVQPVVNELGTLVLFLDGVLYNQKELRKALVDQGYPAQTASPASLALHLYEVCGMAGIARLQGIFTLILWDRTRQMVTLADDRFSLRPLYYSHKGNWFAFSSEVKALLDLPFVSRKLDDSAVADLFSFDHLFGDKTLFEDIRLMQPGSILTYQDGKLQTQSYWHLQYRPSLIQKQEAEWAEEMVTLLGKSLRKRLDIWPNLGLSLSGGLDSRTLLAVATQCLGVKLPTYTYGLANSNDIIRARAAARCAGTPHHESIFDNNYLSANAERMVDRTEGMINCLESHGFNLLDLVPPDQVIMLGTGAENWFSSVRSYLKFSYVSGEDPVCTFFKAINRIFPQEQWPELFSKTYYPRIKGRAFQSLVQTAMKYQGYPPDNLLDLIEMEVMQRSWLQGIYMINHRLEYCLPFYDYDLVDFALTLPYDLRWGRKLEKVALSRAYPDLAKSPGGPLDEESPLRKTWKRGVQKGKQLLNRLQPKDRESKAVKPTGTFTDLHSLLRGSNRNWVEKVLLDCSTLGRDYFNPQAIHTIVDDHMSGKRNMGRQLGTLLTFELWQRQFID